MIDGAAPSYCDELKLLELFRSAEAVMDGEDCAASLSTRPTPPVALPWRVQMALLLHVGGSA
eukprot:8464017-Heterocapsa_arctica.AAC.1